MSVMKAIFERRSIRQYISKQVEDEKLERILEAIRLAPSANNSQAWKFIVVKDPSKIAFLAESSGQMFIKQAPVVIAACGMNTGSIMKCGQYRYTVDVSIAFTCMMLEACELGLGTCWLGHFDEKKAKEILEVPDDVRIVALSPLGYPNETPGQRPRKKLEEIVAYDKWK